MIILHFQLQLQFRYELFHIYSTSFHSSREDKNSINLTSLPMCGFIAQLVEHGTGIHGGHGFESRRSPDFFRLLLSNCLNWKIYCDDHPSLLFSCLSKCAKARFSSLYVERSWLSPRVPLFCSYHILTSSVIYYWTDARQHGIYSLNRLCYYVTTFYLSYPIWVSEYWLIRHSWKLRWTHTHRLFTMR